MLGPDDNPFDLSGHLQLDVRVKGLFTSVHITAPGALRLETNDGNVYHYECTNYDIEGLMGKDKVMMAVGKVRVFDLKNKMVSVITFDAQKDQRYGYLSSFVMGTGDYVDPKTNVSPHRKDLVSIEIHTLNINDEFDPRFKDESLLGPVVARGHGSYLEKIQYEGDAAPVWTINDKFRLKSHYIDVEEHNRAPSDSSYRPDLQNLLTDHYDEAEAAKHEIEVLQRKDKALRIAAAKKHKK